MLSVWNKRRWWRRLLLLLLWLFVCIDWVHWVVEVAASFQPPPTPLSPTLFTPLTQLTCLQRAGQQSLLAFCGFLIWQKKDSREKQLTTECIGHFLMDKLCGSPTARGTTGQSALLAHMCVGRGWGVVSLKFCKLRQQIAYALFNVKCYAIFKLV